jgi:hypothetical protein
MRLWLTILLLAMSAPTYAQGTTTSGAMSMVNVSDPPPSSSTTAHLITPPTTVAPGLAAAGIETCLGSASGGLSVMGGGFTFGSTKVDEGCTIRLLARQLFAFGFKSAALALMCEDDHVALAMQTAGTPCPELQSPVSPREHVAALVPESPALPTLSFASQEAPAPVFATAPRPSPPAPEMKVKPFTPEEDALFKRMSNMQ